MEGKGNNQYNSNKYNSEQDLNPVVVSDDCNYIAAFLTMSCPYTCSYCINEFESSRKFSRLMTADQWVQGLSRLVNLDRTDGAIPVTLQGGEPSVHPGFYDIINKLPERIRIDILTNLWFDPKDMISRVDPARLRRDAPYASIRISYHVEQVEFDELLAKTIQLQEAGFSVGLYGVLHPETADVVLEAQQRAKAAGIDFRTKEFLGYYKGRLYGHYHYENACNMETTREVMCRTTELLIGPDGSIYRCHHDLYEHFPPVGHILDNDFCMRNDYRKCFYFGHCNPCDIKVKTNRLQQFGHTSVSIKFPEENHLQPQSQSTANLLAT